MWTYCQLGHLLLFPAICWVPKYSMFMVSSLHQKSFADFSTSSFIDIHFEENEHFSWKKNYQNQVIGKDEKTVNGKRLISLQ